LFFHPEITKEVERYVRRIDRFCSAVVYDIVRIHDIGLPGVDADPNRKLAKIFA
jgi:hypothetical protein